MGHAAALFFNGRDPDKQTLIRRIAPTDEQVGSQQERWNELADHLREVLARQSGCAIRSWLQGSYKFATQVRPRRGEDYDIDLGMYFEWEGQPGDGEYGPTELKAMVQSALKSYAKDGKDVLSIDEPAKARCSRIKYKGQFHIDVPSYHLDPDRDARALATGEDEWEDSDPKAIYLWFRDLFDDDERAVARRHVRYLKIWAQLKIDAKARPSSILLTVLVAEAVDALPASALVEDDDGIAAVLHAIVERLERNRTVRNPVNRDEVLSSRLSSADYDQFIAQLKDFRRIALDALRCPDALTAADKWAEAFAHFFPAPDEGDVVVAESTALVPIKFEPEIRVRAVGKNNPALSWTKMNFMGPIPKDCDIWFDLINASLLPPGAEVRWMVRNEGQEAEYVNDLGHRVAEGATTKYERSAYKGTHFMDCTVIHLGRVIGFRRVPVIITGASAPLRNPTARPAYVSAGR
jgi:hypothetical protein